MRYFQNRPFSMEQTNNTFQGSLLCIFGLGTLITGQPGIGKSELALGLINRGHQLIADDMAVFEAIEGTIFGSNPLAKPFLHIRGLGLLDICLLFGPNSYKAKQRVDLVIHLQLCKEPPPIAVHSSTLTQNMLGCLIPYITIPIIQTRHLEILVEAIVKKQLIINNPELTAQSSFEEQIQNKMEQFFS